MGQSCSANSKITIILNHFSHVILIKLKRTKGGRKKAFEVNCIFSVLFHNLFVQLQYRVQIQSGIFASK